MILRISIDRSLLRLGATLEGLGIVLQIVMDLFREYATSDLDGGTHWA